MNGSGDLIVLVKMEIFVQVLFVLKLLMAMEQLLSIVAVFV